MRKIGMVLIASVLMFAACTTQQPKVGTKVEIKDGWFYINGQKTFMNAIGYEIGARPGENPKEHRKLQLARMKNDLEVIKDAGFNAIRTWDVLHKEELQVVEQSGLKCIMGIEVDSRGDFSNPAFIEKAVKQVDTALSYSKDFDCIVAYLVMNEPMPEHLNKVGAQATYDLWKKLADRIHEKCPGIPVSISGNSAITEWLNMNIFDLYTYNAYDYGQGMNYPLGYANSNSFLKEMNGQNKPLIITEFGYSVSRNGGGNYTYGGNTLDEQKTGLIKYYRGLLDAGAAGACPFYYADGWWKGGEPAVHNDVPEEWFGYWGYADVKDTIGYPRPVWYALKNYNEALIASPKNQNFYQNEVPVEIFTQPDVAKVRVIYHDKKILESTAIKNNYFTDTISFAGEGLTDRELVFEFYNNMDKLLKYETLIVLTGKDKIEWPTLTINISPNDLNSSKKLTAEINVKSDSIFRLDNSVRYVFQHHIFWNPGDNKVLTIDPAKKEQAYKVNYDVPAESLITALYAGLDIHYGKFTKTIFDYKFVYRDKWADAIKAK